MKKGFLIIAMLFGCMMPGLCGVNHVALRDSILANISGAVIERSDTFDVTRFGANGDGRKDCAAAFVKAITKMNRRGGGVVNVPKGVFYIRGPINLKSNVILHLDKDAILRFDPTPSLYPIVESSWEGTYCFNYSPMIRAYEAVNTGITGSGLIDGNAMTTFATWKPLQKSAKERSRRMNHDEVPFADRRFGEGDYLRPQLIQFYECSGVTIEGVKIINSPFWCIHLLRSENIICRGIRYDAKLINNDGIDPESSRDILIEDIFFNNGDDNIAIKSGRDNDGRNPATPPTENVVIRNCHFKGLHAVVLGSELSAGIRNVIIENCDAIGYCKRGFYLKTNPDRGGFVENVSISNCTFGNVEDLFYITASYAGEGLDNNHFTTIWNISVDGLRADTVSAAAIVIQGVPQLPVRDISLRGVAVKSAKIGLSIEHARDVTFNDCFIGGRVTVPSQVSAADNIFK